MADPVTVDLTDVRDVLTRLERLERIEKAARELVEAEDAFTDAEAGTEQEAREWRRMADARRKLWEALEAKS